MGNDFVGWKIIASDTRDEFVLEDIGESFSLLQYTSLLLYLNAKNANCTDYLKIYSLNNQRIWKRITKPNVNAVLTNYAFSYLCWSLMMD